MQHFGTTTATSPLPDSTALEAGIIEDDRTSRLSRVQDNVRNLLRTSVFGSVVSSPTSPSRPRQPQSPGHLQTHPVQNPLRSHPPSPVVNQRARTEVLPSPTESTASSEGHNAEHARRPPGSYYQNIQRMAHQSAMFNSRAVAALNHPDLSDPSLTDLSQQKTKRRQHRGWARSRTGSGSRSVHGKRAVIVDRAAGSQGLLLTLAALLLAALVATYVSLATNVQGVTTTFHVLFILGILLATIVFSHALIRFFLASRRRSRNLPTFVRVTRHGQYRQRQHGPRHQHSRQMPTLAGETEAFVPSAPIQVLVPGDEAQTTNSTNHSTSAPQIPRDWEKPIQTVRNPPPAYGRWRDSVRANPDLLHWQSIPSPVIPGTPGQPSPTYEEAMSEAMAAAQSHPGSHPPSYMTRDSPARRREMLEARAGLARSQVVEPETEPEMFEIRPPQKAASGAHGPHVGLAM
ncbi:hypothetical protein AC579_45 [Pseudocercospora musae]|uniref:Uncharacterized protein n=1 Tax=Pseudocercospora musae TaxID=113226 RepID=A0A139IGA2_9PEZI|nr:hypothetical protein AC579_45 [Pseudocercospora musae]